MRLIDADSLERKWQDVLDEKAHEKGTVAYTVFELFIERLKEEPTIEAKPVVHGEWVWDVETHGDPMYGVDEDFGYRCSECKVWADEYGVDGDIYEEPPTHILHFCPNCGADMRGET